MRWIDAFTDRQKQEIEFSSMYVNQFKHGTDGHNAKIIIAQMAAMLTDFENGVSFEQVVEQSSIRAAHENKPS